MLMLFKVKVAAAACAAVVAGGLVTAQVNELAQGNRKAEKAQTFMATEAATPAKDQKDAPGRAELSDGVEVEIVGIAPIRANKDAWFTVDGKTTADPSGPFAMHQ